MEILFMVFTKFLRRNKMNFNPKVKDTIAIGALAGIIGSIQISIVNFIFLTLGFTITPE